MEGDAGEPTRATRARAGEEDSSETSEDVFQDATADPPEGLTTRWSEDETCGAMECGANEEPGSGGGRTGTTIAGSPDASPLAERGGVGEGGDARLSDGEK